MAESSPIPARVFQRHQSQIARDLLATLKPIRSLDDQHERQCRQRTHSGMGHQALGLRTLLHVLLDRLTQCGDRRVQSIQQLQQILAVYLPAKPRSTAAKRTRMRDVPTTITRMSLGGSSFGAPSLRFTVAWSFTKTLADPNGRVAHHLSTDL